MKKMSKNILKMSLLIGMLVCLLSITTNVNAATVSNTAVGSSGTEIISMLSSSVFKLIGELAPKAFEATKTIATLLVEKGGDFLKEKLNEMNNPTEDPEEELEDDPEEYLADDPEEELEDDPTEYPVAEGVYGDLNDDGEVTKEDADALAYHILKQKEITDKQALKNADVNLDNIIDGYDYKIISRFLNEEDEEVKELPIELKEEKEDEEENNLNAKVYGDLDNNETVDQEDLKILMAHILKMEKITDKQALKNADVNLDNEIDGDDFLLVYKLVTGEIEKLPVEEEEEINIESDNTKQPKINVNEITPKRETEETVTSISDGLGKVINIFKGSDLLNVFKNTISTITSIFLK